MESAMSNHTETIEMKLSSSGNKENIQNKHSAVQDNIQKLKMEHEWKKNIRLNPFIPHNNEDQKLNGIKNLPSQHKSFCHQEKILNFSTIDPASQKSPETKNQSALIPNMNHIQVCDSMSKIVNEREVLPVKILSPLPDMNASKAYNKKVSISPENKPLANLDQSTFDKGKKLGNQDDSMMVIAVESCIHPDNYNLLERKNKGHSLPMLEEELNEKNQKINSITNNQDIRGQNASSSVANTCRICYEGENEEKGILIIPCACTGTCKYIHESCLKKWIENNIAANPKYRSECEICKSEFNMKFYMKYKFSKVKLCSMIKSLSVLIIVTSAILALVFTVIYVVVSSLSSMTDENKNSMINILIGIACGLLVLVVIFYLRNCKKRFYEQYLSEWKIYNLSQEKRLKVRNTSMENNNNNGNQIIIHQAISRNNNSEGAEPNSRNSDVQNIQENRYANYPFIQNINQVVELS